MVRLRGVSRGRSNTLILYLEQVTCMQVFLLSVAPIVPAHFLVQPFRKCFRLKAVRRDDSPWAYQAVCKCLGHDGVIIVSFRFIFSHKLVGAEATGHGKQPFSQISAFIGPDWAYRCNLEGATI
jgi:hypothetical protein